MAIWGGRRSRRVGVLAGLAVLASSAAILPVSPAEAATGQLTLVSTSSRGVKGDGDSFVPSLSADGTKIAFFSSANLVHGDRDDLFDIYVKDVVSGEVTLASMSAGGLKGNGNSWAASLSADGTRVAFYSEATNLDPAYPGFSGVYVKDLVSGAVSLASTSDTGLSGGGVFPSLSADGTKVTFESTSTNLDPADGDAIRDIYVKDLVSGELTLVSTSDTGVKANNDSERPSLSADGSAVAFHSNATNLEGASWTGGSHVYVKSLVSGDLTNVSSGYSDGRYPSLSGDGTKVVFDTFYNVYLSDVASGDVTLISTSAAGEAGNGWSKEASLSADGTKVAFKSEATNLDPADGDGIRDIYVKDLVSGDLTLASISGTGVKGNDTSEWAGLSDDGTTVGFHTYATNLDSADGDTLADVYVKELAITTSITIRDRSVVEGSSTGSKIAFTVSLSNPSSSAVSVQFATIDGTATSPADYTATSGTVSFAPGQTTARIKVAVVPDLAPEGDENFTVQLSNPVGATLGDAVAVGGIRNDD